LKYLVRSNKRINGCFTSTLTQWRIARPTKISIEFEQPITFERKLNLLMIRWSLDRVKSRAKTDSSPRRSNGWSWRLIFNRRETSTLVFLFIRHSDQALPFHLFTNTLDFRLWTFLTHTCMRVHVLALRGYFPILLFFFFTLLEFSPSSD